MDKSIVEQHAEAILNAACTWAEPGQYTDAEWQAILTAVEAAMVAGAEAMREACEQHFRGYGWRNTTNVLDPAAIIKAIP